MILERSEVVARPGRVEAFGERIRTRGIPLLQAVPGVRSVRFERGIENRDRFLFLVVWDDMAAHGSVAGDPFHAEFMALFADDTINGRMEHFELSTETSGA